LGDSDLSATLTLLDVGHGNAAVVTGELGTVVVDAGPGGADLLLHLQEEQISEVNCVVISHADEDHLRGLVAVLEASTIKIDRVKLNPDAIKDTEIWDSLLWTLDHLDQEGELSFETSCTVGEDLPAVEEGVSLEIAAPAKRVAGHGPGYVDKMGRAFTTNTSSVVIRIVAADGPVALLPGDVDDVGLSYLVEDSREISATILVFPHHGGNVKEGATVAENEAFADQVMKLVAPQTVVFSTGRGRHGTPRAEIVAAARATIPDVRVACTQLSANCREGDLPTVAPPHLLPLHARGRGGNSCCAGTLRVDLNGDLTPSGASYEAFKGQEAPSALCQL
jgi:beta-lactamase superfamily II metal-dependent hydrolase